MSTPEHRAASTAPIAPVHLETDRLVLSRPSPADAQELSAFLGDERVGHWLGGTLDADTARDVLMRHIAHWDAHGFGLWIARDRQSGAFAGRGGLHLTVVGGRGETEVAWAITPDHWNEGLADEVGRAALRVAGTDLGIDEVVSFTLPANVASRRVMEKLGLTLDREIDHRGLPHVLYRGATTLSSPAPAAAPRA